LYPQKEAQRQKIPPAKSLVPQGLEKILTIFPTLEKFRSFPGGRDG
jgi:hypothetical protein